MDQVGRQKNPAAYERGNRFTFENRTWVVTDYTISANNAGYDERQWTVQDERNRETAYLLLCEGAGDSKGKWVFTKQIGLSEVYLSSGEERSFGDGMPGTPPPEAIYMGVSFAFKESYTTKAEDDDGNRVPKETWDYFDTSGTKNLAFEIWKEPDADYPEAYLGTVIDPDGLCYVGSKSVPVAPKQLNALWTGLMVPGFLFFTGVPGDWLLFVSLPALSFITAYLLSPFCLWAVLAITTILCALFFTIFFNMPALMIGFVTIAVVTAMIWYAASMNDDLVPNIPWVSGLAALASTSIYSFIIYFRFAPGPHHAGQLGATILVPLVIGGLTVVVNWGLGNLWPNTGSNGQ